MSYFYYNSLIDREDIELSIYEFTGDAKQKMELWNIFKSHHYLSNDMNKASTVYLIYWGDTLIGIRTYLPMPSGTSKYSYRGSRLVLLPDYQNLGFGAKILEYLGEYYLSCGYKYFDRSSHLRLGRHWSNDPKWEPTSSNEKVSNDPGKTAHINFGARDRELQRVAYSFEYMGKDYVEKPHIEIFVEDGEGINYDILEKDLAYLKEKYWICLTTGEIKTPSKIEDICLKLGIRTQLLYNTKNGVQTMIGRYKDKNIIRVWDEELSAQIRDYFDGVRV